MYRDGVYNRNYGLDRKANANLKRSGQPLRDRDLEYYDGSNLVKGDAGVSRRHSRREAIPELGQDPHGYGLAQDNFEDLKQQLNELEVDDHKKQRYLPTSAEPPEPPPYPIPPPPPGGKPYVSSSDPPLSEGEVYSSGYSSDESSPDEGIAQQTPQTTQSKSRSPIPLSMQKGYREARHFAGGIIHHPAESTKHYSIIRHSHGLVFYQGTTTSVAISIFADTALPPNRTIWLTPKKWTSTSKNRATFRQQTGAWLNVTPDIAVKADQINPSDERAWQRDIIEFEKRTRRGPRSGHRLRETDVLRIPPDAGDGYFQLVLCVGEQEETLCISPVFRILSVSTNMGAISGANWATLPLEIGAIALSMRAQAAVGAAIMPAKLAVKGKAKGKAGKFMPQTQNAAKAKMAGKLAYGATGASQKVDEQLTAFNSNYKEERGGTFTPVWKIEDADHESGPKHPYPIRFAARCEIGSSNSADQYAIPLTKLVNVPEVVTYKLSGHYFGWCATPPARIERNGRIKKHHHWYQAVIIVSPIDVDDLDRITMSRANRKNVHLQILADVRDQPLNNADVKIEVLGCLRPWDPEIEREALEPSEDETAMINEMSDITLTQTILDEPAWGPGAGSEQKEDTDPKPKVHGMERLKQEYTEKRLAVQRKIDQVPLHKVGVRMPVDRMRDKSVVRNGFFIRR